MAMESQAEMSRGRPQQRERLIAGAVEYVLANGVGQLSLRPLAAALQTSDRMLLYYFNSREQLITEVLAAVSDELQATLGSGFPDGHMRPGALLRHVWALLADDRHDDALRLYLEVDALAARGRQPYAAAAEQVTTSWRTWLAARLDVPSRSRSTAAAAVLAVIDGLLLQRLTTDRDIADKAARWIGAFMDR